MTKKPSFGKLFIRALSELWIQARSHAVGKMIFLTFFWGAIVMVLNILLALFNVSTQAAPFIQLGILIFFILMTITWIVLSFEQTKTEFSEEQGTRELLAGVLAIAPTFLITALLTWSSVSYSFYVLEQPLHVTVSNYTTCVKAGGVVLQTSPQQCVTTSGTYTQGQ